VAFGAALGAFGIASGPIPADHLDSGMGFRPGREGVRRAIRQQADHMTALHIDQHRLDKIVTLDVRRSQKVARPTHLAVDNPKNAVLAP
jgi:hypothetical protein